MEPTRPTALWGQGGEDVLYGQGGDDVLRGGGDSDILFGGKGFDTLNGQAGNDAIKDIGESSRGGSGIDRCDGSGCELDAAGFQTCNTDDDCGGLERCVEATACVSCEGDARCNGHLLVDFQVTVVDAGN